MKNMVFIMLFFCIALTIALADTIHMKNGLKIEGEIVNVDADSVTIRTASGLLTIAAVDIDRIETAQIPKVEPERVVVTERGIPRSITTVGYGCLGGLVGGAAAWTIGAATEGYGGSAQATAVVSGMLVIVGIVLGAIIGSR